MSIHVPMFCARLYMPQLYSHNYTAIAIQPYVHACAYVCAHVFIVPQFYSHNYTAIAIYSQMSIHVPMFVRMSMRMHIHSVWSVVTRMCLYIPMSHMSKTSTCPCARLRTRPHQYSLHTNIAFWCTARVYTRAARRLFLHSSTRGVCSYGLYTIRRSF